MRNKTPYILLLIFSLLTLGGILLGEVAKVLGHATIVCLDCIGIG